MTYLLKSTIGVSFLIDEDEIALIRSAKDDHFIFFRNGAVKKKLVGTITEYTSPQDPVLRLSTETKEQYEVRKREAKLPDIFENSRSSKVRNIN